jgi:hypothetical protein
MLVVVYPLYALAEVGEEFGVSHAAVNKVVKGYDCQM